MRKLYLLLLANIMGYVVANAIPANPTPAKVLQPDGSYLTVCLFGDEFMHYTTTQDGYTVVKSPSGYYMYAELADGQLVASSHIARDEVARTSADLTYLHTVQKNLKPELTATGSAMRGMMKSMAANPLLSRKNAKFDISKFRGLIILVEFNDCAFSRADIHDHINDMVNKKDYDGYMTTSLIPEKVECTGSVRDYYYDNSMGAFTPQFDVVGPVKINYSKYDAGGSGNGMVLAASACRAADELVDFSRYDGDGDGKADMVYFIFAGYGANTSGNNSDLLWPHASKMFGVRLDGVSVERYACSTEMYGREGSNVLDGIGTICHEFSHVLGLPDEYDTDYASSGGQGVHPSSWSIMASGSYRNKSRTPVGYTLYERYALGFATPKLIDAPGSFSLDALNTSNSGYRINTSLPNEFFLIDNRQQTRWDAYLLGHGMTVTRVDSTSVDVWENNKINCNPAHQYLELLRATPKTKTSGSTVTVSDSDGDPFPGSGNVTEITNQSTPSLRSWTQASTPLEIKNIQESADGVITFDVEKAALNVTTEDFEAMDLSTATKTVAQGRFCTWTLTGCYYSLNGGKTWVAMKNVDGIDNVTVSANSSLHIIYNIESEKPCFKITETVGSTSAFCHIDDFAVTCESVASGITTVTDSAAPHFSLTGNTLTVSSAASAERVAVYDLSGTLVLQQTLAAGTTSLQLPAHGVYVVVIGRERFKVAY